MLYWKKMFFFIFILNIKIFIHFTVGLIQLIVEKSYVRMQYAIFVYNM